MIRWQVFCHLGDDENLASYVVIADKSGFAREIAERFYRIENKVDPRRPIFSSKPALYTDASNAMQ